MWGYEYKGSVEPFIEVVESIAVKNSEAEKISLKFTRHGPVVAETKKHAFVVRAAWLEPGMPPTLAALNTCARKLPRVRWCPQPLGTL